MALSKVARFGFLSALFFLTITSVADEIPVNFTAGTACTVAAGNCVLTGTTAGGIAVNFQTPSAWHHTFVGQYGIQASPGDGELTQDTSINQLLVTVPGYTFHDLQVGIYGLFLTNLDGSPNDSLRVYFTTVNDPVGYVVTYAMPTNPHGSTLMYFLADAGNPFTSISLGYGSGEHSTGARFYALDNISISGPNAVPEPATLMLLMSGLGLAGTLRRRFLK
jgi:hypothetical protein